MTDLKLKNDHVTVEGSLKVYGPDLHLSLNKRKDATNTSRYRRALVHGRGDILIFNFSNDYNGIILNGEKEAGIQLHGKVILNDNNIEEMIKGLQDTIDFLLKDRTRVYSAINALNKKAGLPLTATHPINVDLGPTIVIPPSRRL